ncbi:hypothetical protein DIPPA_03328 [Diplonema papillatum]|nr:hypothetical protein DIPPA_31593 [Diplonema papillatum]KAJ9441651.1 hypothetical protein DIPPA_03328 [Diplonema papillatum]
MCAARAAQQHASEELQDHSGSLATVAVDGCDFRSPVLNGDLVKVESTPVLVGRSSIAVNVKCSRRDLGCREWEPVQTATYTLVLVSRGDGKPLKVAPQLEYTTAEEEQMRDDLLRRRAVVASWAEMNDAVAEMPAEDLLPPPVTQNPTIPCRETTLVMRRLFLPRHLNFNNTIFGGDVLEWMETGAIHCAMNFVGHRDIITIAMNRVEFILPIVITDWVELHTQVVYVSDYTVHVEVRITKEASCGPASVTSHVGNFVCMPISSHTGRKKKVMTGLAIESDDVDSLRKHHAAKVRYDFWKKHYKANTAAFPK